MHYFVHRDLRSSPLIRWQLVLYLTMVLIFLGLTPWIQAQQIGLTPHQVRMQFFGDEATFLVARPAVDLATQVHIQLFFDSIVALVSGAVILRAQWSITRLRICSVLLFTLPLLRAVSVPLALYLSSSSSLSSSLSSSPSANLSAFFSFLSALFTWLVVAAFWLNWLLQCAVTGFSLIYLLKRPPHAPPTH